MELQIKTKSGRTYQRIAWMGGDSAPKELRKISRDYRNIITFFFREQLRDFSDFWKELPDMDTTRIFWKRAKADAWSTYREQLFSRKKW